MAAVEKVVTNTASSAVANIIQTTVDTCNAAAQAAAAFAMKYSDPVQLRLLVTSIGILVVLFVVGYFLFEMAQKALPRFFWLSHTEDMDKIDDELRESMTKALTAYYLGVPIPNYLKQKGPFPKVYAVDAAGLQKIVDAVDARLNVHKKSATYRELKAILDAAGIKPTHKQVYEFFYKVMAIKDHPVKAFVKGNTAVFKAELARLNEASLFNFIDYYPYEHAAPERDKTLKRYGSLATPEGKALAEIFSLDALPKAVRPLLSTNAEGISKAVAAKEDRLRTLLVYLRSSKKDVFASAGINEGDYLSDVKEHESHPSASIDGAHPRTKLSIAVHEMEALIDALEAKVAKGVTQADLDLMQTELHYNYEAYLTTKYDMGNGEVPVLTKKQKDAYMYAYGEVLALLQYRFYKQTIDDSIFVMLYWYFGYPQNLNKNMQQLSEFYLGFNELMLFKTYDDHVKDYRAWRAINKENVDDMFMNNLFMPNFNLYIRDNIMKGIVLDWLDWPATFRETECSWNSLVTLLGNPGTFLGKDFDTGARAASCNTNTVKVAANTDGQKSTGLKFKDSSIDDDTFKEGFEPEAGSAKSEAGSAKSDTAGSAKSEAKPEAAGSAKSEAGSAKSEAKAGSAKPEVREGFFGVLSDIANGLAALPGLAVNAIRLCVDLVGRVIPAIMQLLPTLIQMVVSIVTDVLPNFIKILMIIMKYIDQPLPLLKLLAGFIIYVITTIVMLVLKLSFVYPLGQIIYVYFIKIKMFFIGLAYAVYNAALFAFIVAVGFVLAILDGVYFDGSLSRTFYSWFLACETSPFQWHENAHYQTGNKFERKAGVCARPCPEGYEPAMGGFACVRTPDYIPKQCPQSAIQRLYKEKSIKAPYVLSQTIPHIDWGNLNRNGKLRMVKDIQDSKGEYHATCAVKMQKYDDVSLNVCRNLDVVAGNVKDHAVISELCDQTYCRNGKSEPWCYKHRDSQQKPIDGIQNENVFMQMLMYSVIIVSFIAIIYLFHRGKLLTPRSSL